MQTDPKEGGGRPGTARQVSASRVLSIAGLVAGLAAMTALLLWHGVTDILRLLSDTGWSLFWLPVIWFPSLLAAARGWQFLFPDADAPPFRQLLRACWMGRAVNTLLPVATIGGELARARLIVFSGARGVDAGAAIVVDKTIQALAIVPWGVMGCFLLYAHLGEARLAAGILGGLLVLGLGILGFIHVQRAGAASFLANLAGRFIIAERRDGVIINARELDSAIHGLYASPRRLILSLLWQTFSLILETSEVWLACRLMGHPLGLQEALLLKSLISTLDNVAFFIPNGYGVQEGGYVMVGALLGLSPGFALALSLATRIREWTIDLPGLLTWQWVEGRRLLSRGHGAG